MSEKFDALIAEKDKSAEYIVNEITHICKNLPKRDPGSEGERLASEYMADVLKNDCGCEKVDIESFDENPGSFYGWIHITFTLCFIALILIPLCPGSKVAAIIGICCIAIGWGLALLQFGLYKKVVDFMFPKKVGTNVTAIKSCKGEVKRRIFFNGHQDAAWEWPANYLGGGVLFEGLIIISAIGTLYYLGLDIAILSVGLTATIAKMAYIGLIFVPFWIYMFFMWNRYRIVDGANDNLSGCYMGIAILKAMKDAGIELENTEVGVILSGSEEAGLRGSKAWCEAHKGEFQDVPTFIYSYDTIHDPKYLLTNYRDLNATVKADKDVSDLFMEAAQELNIQCKKGMVPPLGGATDNAAFAQGGFRSTGITGLNHKLENYYHTRRDSYDNMDNKGLADCYAVSVRVLDKFDEGAKQ